jgi:ribosomal protein S18 acetylase RimI-like enzyme
MVAASSAVHGNSNQRLRPINLRRDSRQIWELLDLVFGPTLDAEGRRILDSNLALSYSPNVMLQIGQAAGGLVPGFVWEEESRIVGNISLLGAKTEGRYLIANVAVHPSQRRRGIGRALVREVIKYIQGRHGRSLWLQVESTNESAQLLYERLGFAAMGNVTTWDLANGRLRQLWPGNTRQDKSSAPFAVRPLRRAEWRAAYNLDRAGLNPALNWPEPIERDAYKQGVWRWLGDFLNGRQWESWVMADDNGALVGMVTIGSEWYRPHQLSLRVSPGWQGQLERPLLAKALRRLTYLRAQGTRMDHPENDLITEQLLREANFHARRTLTIMKLELSV